MKRKYMGLTALVLALALCLSACGMGMNTDTNGTAGTNGTDQPAASPQVTSTPVPDNDGDVTDHNGVIGDEPAARDDGMDTADKTGDARTDGNAAGKTGDRRTDGDNTSGNDTGSAVGDAARDVGDAAGDVARDVGDAVGDVTRDAGNAIGSAADSMTGGKSSGTASTKP